MADIVEIAVAAWRLEKWLDNVNVERKMAAKSALRTIKKYLIENNIEIIDLTGTKFDVGLAISVVNNESSETDEDKLLISEMVKPIIKENGAVIQYGQVILGDEVKKPKENNVVDAQPLVEVKVAEEKVVDAAQIISDNVTEIPETKTDELFKNKKSHWTSMAVCIVGLQIVIIALVLLTFIKIGNLTIIGNQLVDDKVSEKIIESESNALIDLSSIETGLDGVESRLDTVEYNLDALLDKINSSEDNAVGEDSFDVDDFSNEEDSYITYIVQKGDTLIKICQEQGIDFYTNCEFIMLLNDMDDVNVLEVGQELLLPKEE